MQFNYYFNTPPQHDWSQFLGAFAGAFFAFVFGIVAYRITKRWERFIDHKNALVKLERTLNRHAIELAILEKLVNDAIEIIQPKKSLLANRLFNLKIPEDLDLELASLKLINKLFIYQDCINRFNINASALNHAFTRFEDIKLSGQDLHDNNYQYAIKMLSGLSLELPSLLKKGKDFLVEVRLNLKKLEQNGSFIYGVFHSKWEFEISQTEIIEEAKKLDQEIAANENF